MRELNALFGNRKNNIEYLQKASPTMTTSLKTWVAVCTAEIPKRLWYNNSMSANVDMTYRFVWDTDPTDEQLCVIMQEVGEEARRKSEKIAKQIIENIERESARIRSALQTQHG